MVAIDGYIPAATNAQVVSIRNYLDEATCHLIVLHLHLSGNLGEDFTRTVGRVIVHHDHIKLEVGFLAESTLHGIGDGLLTVEHRDDHGSLVFKLLFVEVGLAIEVGIHQGTHFLQMLGASLLHLYLHLSVARVHIIELLLATLSGVKFVLGIEKLIEMEDFAYTAQIKTEIVETSKLIICTIVLGNIVIEILRFDKPKTSEVEVITKRAWLVVDDRMLHQFAFRLRPLSLDCLIFHNLGSFIFHHRIVVGVNHHSSCIIRCAEETLQGIESPTDRGSLGTNHHIVGIGILGDAAHGVGTFQSVDDHKGAAIRHLMMSGKVGAHQEIDMLNCLVVVELGQSRLGYLQVFTRQE